MKSVFNIYVEDDKYYEYVEDHEDCAIYRELKGGQFLAFNIEDEQVCREPTLSSVRSIIESVERR